MTTLMKAPMSVLKLDLVSSTLQSIIERRFERLGMSMDRL